MKCTTLFRQDDHRWLAFGQDPDKPGNVIDTNQIVITSGEDALMLDPGGSEIFHTMVAALTEKMPIEQIGHLVLSHQDPDVTSSLPLWRQICRPDMTVHVSWMWAGFVSHFDSEANFETLPDEGRRLRLGGREISILPAHYLHSPGNYCLYDPAAKILFTGDIGAAMVPPDKIDGMFVHDFDAHIQYMEGFHRRWMGSEAARDAWVRMVRKLDVELLAPQHGLMFKGDDVGRFLDWLSGLTLGSGLESFEKAV